MSSTAAAKKPALKSLSAEPGSIASFFHPNVREYVIYLSPDESSTIITAEAEDSSASITVDGDPLDDEGRITLEVERGINRHTLTLHVDDEEREIKLKIVRYHATPNWKQLTEQAPFPGRDSAGELVYDDYLWLFGGYLPEVVSDVWRSKDGEQWEQLADIPATNGVNIPMRWIHDGSMWITSQKGELFRSNDGEQWDIVTDNAPWIGRRTAGTVTFKDRMWVIGGADKEGRKSDVWSSADGIDWRLETDSAPWPARQLWDNVVVYQDKIWVIGGGVQRYHPSKSYRDVWCSEDGKNWTCVTRDAPWEGRQWNSCIVYRDRLWMLAGYQSEPTWRNMNDVWYSEDGANWKQLKTPRIWSPRHEISPYVKDGKLFVVAGNAWPLMADVWELDIPGIMFLTEPVLEDFVGGEYRYRAEADFHAGGGPVKYELISSPPWLTVDEAGIVQGKLPDDVGEFAVTLKASSAKGESVKQQWTLAVVE